MPEVFENIIDLVGGLIIAEKKKKKKLRIVASKYPSTAIMAIRPRVRARPVLPAYVALPAPFVAPFAPARRGPKPGSKNKKKLAEDDLRLASALASAELEASSRRRGERRESGTASEASSRRGRPRKAVAVRTDPESERGERSTGTERPRRRKAKAPPRAEEEKEGEEEFAEARPFFPPVPPKLPGELALLRGERPETVFPALRDSPLVFTPGKESGLKKDGTPALSTTRGRELAARVEAGEIPAFIPIPKGASPFASVRREASVAPPATVPKKKADPAKKKAASDLERLFFEGLAPVRAEAKTKSKKASPREEARPAIVEAPGFPPAIGSGMRRRRRVRMH